MFDVRAGPAIESDDGPAIRQHLCVVRSQIDHWLHCKHISRFYFRALAGLPIIRYLRIFMHAPANSMANIIAHYGITVPFSVLLHCRANVAQMFAGTTFLYRLLKAFFS